nr:hypothetical protein BaRGS_024865 [Batillaria attramentaria]
MLVYVKNRAFPLLHILYELGKDDHQFRLRYNGQVLRDAFTLTDYDITDNAVVTMVPMGKSKDALMEIHSDNGCHDWEFEGTCSHRNVYTAVFFTLHSVLLIVTAILSWILLANFRVEVGDLIENCLVQERDIDQVMAAARNGRVKEKRIAAFDLSAMAASSDDNKFRIVAEGGPRAMQEAASALYNIVAESEENKAAVVAEHGLEDLSHAAREGTIACQRTVAGVLLELAFNADVRAQMASSNVPAHALVYLCHSNDADTLRFTLQTLELLAIESSELICAQTELLEMLLDFPFRTMDDRLYLLASKILLYFAENAHTCEQLLGQTRVLESLVAMARTHSAVLQKVVVKIVHCMLEVPQLRTRAREEKMDSVLEYVRDHAADRDAWDMADECLQLMTSAHDLSDLPTLSTMEKLNKMKVKDDSFGSRTSMGSEGKGGSGGLTGSSGDVKKGIA